MSSPHSALSSELIAAIEAGACVLTPNQRSAHWLKLLYANHAVAHGRAAWATPAIHSFNSYVAQLWRTHGDASERVLSTEQSQLLWERVVADSTWSEQLLSPQAAASTSYRAWERLQAWCITREQLAEQAAATESAEAQALVEWSERYAALCRERAWLPVALLPKRLLQHDLSAPHLVTITDDLAPNHHALLKQFESRGTRCQTLVADEVSRTLSVEACESQEQELRVAAAWAKEQLLAGTQNIGVVVPDLDQCAAQVSRVFAEVFTQAARTFVVTDAAHDRVQREPVFALANYHRLADFPIVRAALDLLQLANGRASSALAGSVLRNPFLHASTQEASSRALADARLRAQAREHYDLVVLERIAIHCPVLNKSLRDAQSLRMAAPPRALPSAMAEHFIALWRALGWPGEQTLASEEQQIAARLQAALAEFGALDELLGPLTFANAVREFEQLTRNASFEPRSAPTPITLIDVQAIDGLYFDAAWVIGMNETRWPPSAAPDAFIPIALQVRAGMPNATAQLTREHARRRFLQLQSIANAVVFSWARKDNDAELLPSPWLAEISDALDVHGAPEYAAQIYAAKPVLEIVEENHTPPLLDARARGGTRIFELQSLCPFRAFAELRLDAKPLEQVVPSVDARERGTLIHAALADLWQALGGSAGLQSRTQEQLEVQVRTALARHAEKFLEGASLHRVRMLQIEQDIAAERILALLNLDRQRAPFRVVGRPETQEQATIGALTFALRLDRMDELLDEQYHGERVIVDYKTGNNVSTQSWTRERPEQPQLPLYAVTHPQGLAAVTFATVGAKSVSYQGVARDAGVLPGIKAFNDKYLPAPYTQWSGLLAFWESVITRLANQFAQGAAQVDPLPTACRYCHLSVLCRVNDVANSSSQDEEAS